MGEGKSGQLGLGEDVQFAPKLIPLPVIVSPRPRNSHATFTMSRSSNPSEARSMSISSEVEWFRGKVKPPREEIRSIHAAALTSAVITSTRLQKPMQRTAELTQEMSRVRTNVHLGLHVPKDAVAA